MPDEALVWIAAELGIEEQCLDLAERLRWPEGVRCVQCGSSPVFRFLVKEKTKLVKRADGRIETVVVPARRLYECIASRHQFTVTTGTVFHDTHLPLVKWFFAVALIINGERDITARYIQRQLGVSYKTAWYLCHRIREGLEIAEE